MSLIPEIDELARRQIIAQIKKWKTSSFLEMPSAWATEHRYLPQGVSNFPGKIDHSIAPHLIEIQDSFHPDSGIKSVSIMKSTQSLATTTIENVIGWAIRHKLHNILYIISSKSMAKARSSAAIDVLIDYSNLQDCIKPISTRMKRKTADNTFYKEMSGGYRLMMTSYNSIADAKSFSWDFIIFDEIDEAPFELKGQGDPEALFTVRGITARHLKMAKLSTPTNTQGRIYKNFLEGDQRYFYCQCPLCGEKQILKMKTSGRDFGLTFRTEKNGGIKNVIADTVNYICEYCLKPIQEHKKQDMLTGGEWRPTAQPVNPEYRSYHISNLMSPIMFYTWGQVCKDFLETGFGQNINKFKTFVINILGEPWESRSEKKSWSDLKARAENYVMGEIPNGGLIVTGGADIQKNRIELQVAVWGVDMECWIIDYQTFWGETKDKNNQCWRDFANYLKQKKYKIKNITLPIAMTAIDSGYNPIDEKEFLKTDIMTEHVVYEFVARTARTIASRGNEKLKDTIIRQEKIKRKSLLKIRYDMAVNELKDETFIKIDLQLGSQGYIHFPDALPDEYFQGFCSEIYAEVEPGKWQWKKIFERNEPLDTFILCRVAAEWLNLPTWDTVTWNNYEKNIFS